MSDKIISTEPEKETAFLVGLFLSGQDKSLFEKSMQELAMLADTAEIEILGRYTQNLPKVIPATYIGKGKIEEIKTAAAELGVKTLIFDDDLSPAQARNISDSTECNVVDRTELILDIFSKHAKTKQAKMQVELAQLEYSYSRLKRKWQHLSRIEGGIGFRGPGETQIETDRREIKRKTQLLRERLLEEEKVAHIKRKKRRDFVNISLVGYTNAGKSTLFKALAKEDDVYIADQLFATLDSTTRLLVLKNEDKLVLTDTVGFIRKLPHSLVSSFHTTLLEVTEADLLLHVVDVSDYHCQELMEAVNNVLKEIKADNKETLYVFNKSDLLDSLQDKFFVRMLSEKYPHSVFISAQKGDNLDILKEKIEYFVSRMNKTVILRIPMGLESLISFLHKNGEVYNSDYDPETLEQVLEVKLAPEILQNVKKQIDNFRSLNYINR